MKNKKQKSKINKWKLTAIISLIVNGIVALLLTIGLATPKSYIKTNALDYGFDTSKIIVNTNQVNSSIDYKLYFDWDNLLQFEDASTGYSSYYFPLSNEVPPFQCWFPYITPRSKDGYSITQLLFYKGSGANENISLFGDLYLPDGSHSLTLFYSYHYQIEPISDILECSLTSQTPSYMIEHDLFALYRSFFDGSISISSAVSSSSALNFDTTFLKVYFSQYSVNNLGAELKSNITPYNYYPLKELDLNTLTCTLDGSTGLTYSFYQNKPYIIRVSGTYEDEPVAIKLLDGVFEFGNGNFTSSLWLSYEKVPHSNNTSYWQYYVQTIPYENYTWFYLNSLCPYDLGNAEIRTYQPIINFADTNWEEYEGSFPTQFIVNPTSSISPYNPLTIRKLNVYPNQPLGWANFNILFDVNNHFYYDGSVYVSPNINNDNNINGNDIALGSMFSLLENAFASLVPILSISILPNITLGVLIFLPLVLTIIIVIIKLVKR